MKKSLLISVVMFAAFLAMLYLPTTTKEFTVEFKTPSAKPLDLKSAKLIDEVNAFGLKGISANDNVAAGMYKVADAFEGRNPDPDRVKAMENALGVRVSVGLRSRPRFGLNGEWLYDLHRLTSQNPILRRYLQRHQRTLDQLSSIVNREHFANVYYSHNQKMLLDAEIALASTCRDYENALTIRARVALAEGRIGDAITDVNTIHQLGHHLMQDGGTLVEVLSGTTIADNATGLWCEILSHPEVSLNELGEISKLVKSAPPISGVKAFDVFERLSVLQFAEKLERFSLFARVDMGGMQSVFSRGRMKMEGAILPTIAMAFTDWPEIYNSINRHIDTHVAILSMADDDERRSAIKALDNPLGDMLKQIEEGPNQQSLANNAVWQLIDGLFLHVSTSVLWGLESARQRNEVLNLCIALKRFHIEQQRYPESLEELKGKYLDEIPVDCRTGVMVGYMRLKSGALVYTNGQNGEDNRGWGYLNLSTNGYRTPYDDETYLIGKDDRTPPEGMTRKLRNVPGWTIFTKERFWNRERLSLARENVSLEEFAQVCSIEELKWLDLSLSDLPDKWHHALESLQNLEVLSLVGKDVTEEVMAHIAKLPSLQTLILNGTAIDGNLYPIEGHPNLETLLLARSSVTDNDLLVLETLPNLRKLNLSATEVSDAAGPIFAGLQELTHLQLSGTNISDKTLTDISEMAELLVLGVDFTKVTNVGVAALNNAKLQTLSLIGTRVNNEISDVLAGRNSLQSVFLYETEFDSEFHGTSNAVAFFERPSGDIIDKQDEGSQPGDPQQTKWGKLDGVLNSFEILEDENQVGVRLTSNESAAGNEVPSRHGISVLNSIKGDFDVSVKINPDWDLHDEIMIHEGIGMSKWKGGPCLGAGLLIQQTEGHYLKWSWNSIGTWSRHVYSRITPEYVIYPIVRNGPLADFAFGFLQVEDSQEDELGLPPRYAAHQLSLGAPLTFDRTKFMAYPNLAVEGSLSHFDHLSIWLRLRRQGNRVTAFSSKDGESWALVSDMNTHFADEVQVGIWCGKLCSSDYEFQFEDFTIEQ
tara:strand:+ start:1137 stop:4268 length:3132 start_codon:yes stop_codon:yes gene_type:complete